MSIHATADEVREELADMGNTAFSTKAVYGNASSLLIATRPAGYHSRPHRHDCEQLNWLQSGALWVMIEDRAVLMQAGDFLRVPANARHWSWNKFDAPAVLVEVHTPGLQDDPLVKAFAVGLFDDDETPAYLGAPVNEFLPEDTDFDPSIAEGWVR
ncbi:cupin domain-containing protein [Kribbella sp. NBC_00709]|uniref:cupin domain-containing protein n=1 Tax=Kribbella sp. NBC_00709 TaxID=2975972 RepID=UPI002E28635A|nr:cupin domain-containing protein [Kribbella sp. NBC_00709]